MRKVLVVLTAIAALVIVAASVFFYFAVYDRHRYRDLAEDVQISTEWTEIQINPGLRIEKQVQVIALIVEGARTTAGKETKTYLSDGTVIELDVELKDDRGQWHELRSGSFTVNDFDSNTNSFAARSIDFTLDSDHIPGSTKFVSVRLRSNESLVCHRVRWHAYNMK